MTAPDSSASSLSAVLWWALHPHQALCSLLSSWLLDNDRSSSRKDLSSDAAATPTTRVPPHECGVTASFLHNRALPTSSLNFHAEGPTVTWSLSSLLHHPNDLVLCSTSVTLSPPTATSPSSTQSSPLTPVLTPSSTTRCLPLFPSSDPLCPLIKHSDRVLVTQP